jgi:hypothetical protein
MWTCSFCVAVFLCAPLAPTSLMTFPRQRSAWLFLNRSDCVSLWGEATWRWMLILCILCVTICLLYVTIWSKSFSSWSPGGLSWKVMCPSVTSALIASTCFTSSGRSVARSRSVCDGQPRSRWWGLSQTIEAHAHWMHVFVRNMTLSMQCTIFRGVPIQDYFTLYFDACLSKTYFTFFSAGAIPCQNEGKRRHRYVSLIVNSFLKVWLACSAD